MLICSINLISQLDRPEAAQLFRSLLCYMSSSEFDPKANLEVGLLEQVLKPNSGNRNQTLADRDLNHFG
jgi:hypothetical protein